jgi:hypothetical protein
VIVFFSIVKEIHDAIKMMKYHETLVQKGMSPFDPYAAQFAKEVKFREAQAEYKAQMDKKYNE